jgi:hypothetical protein
MLRIEEVLQSATQIPPQPSHTEDKIEKSQAPDGGCINVRNMLSIEKHIVISFPILIWTRDHLISFVCKQFYSILLINNLTFRRLMSTIVVVPPR